MDNADTVDIHCHTAGAGYGGSGCFISPRLRRNWRYGVYLRAFGVTARELERHGDGIILTRLSLMLAASGHVKYAVVLAMDGVAGPDGMLDRRATEIYIPGEFLAGRVKRHGNLLYGASVNPYRKDALERLCKAAEDGAVLVKWLPPIQGIDPSDTSITPFYKKLAELGMPLLTHTGDERSFTRSSDGLADPERLRLPLEQGVRVVAAHAAASGKSGGQRNMDRLASMFVRHDNLFADISSLTQLNRPGMLARALDLAGSHERLVYGTDMPLINTGLVSPMYFPFTLSPAEMLRLSRIENPWDRDVMLKKALGVPASVFSNTARLLKINTGGVCK